MRGRTRRPPTNAGSSTAPPHRRAGFEDLAAGLLRLSRLEAGDAAREPERLDLTALARAIADAVASRADQAEVDLRVELARGPTWVIGYPDKLGTAIGNLLDNALKFTPAGGRSARLRSEAAGPVSG